ncbi:MAG: terpene cyclase/mutase family protein [Nitrospirales bacterium]|nr:terpene cyclase/mutase family protein [Nitrospirales bacterium]
MIQEPYLYFLEFLQSVQLPNGGFPYHSGEEARPDATAWAIISMSAWEFARENCDRGRAYLVSQQTNDGRISISPTHIEASWPTPLAIFAWESVPQYQEAQSRAIDYLIGFTGQHFSNPDPSIIGHDTSIPGWPWIAETHSWVVPTALALMALHKVGLGTHPRAIAGQQMLLNRQLPGGGWNYGSTTVFNRELRPLPECTAIALQSLAGNTAFHKIERSLQYVSHELPRLRTPISLGWALLGLGAWGLKPANTEELARVSLQMQERYGPYPLPSLALLLCAVKASHGLHSLFRSLPQETPVSSTRN